MHGQRHLHRPDKGGPVSDRRPRRTRRTRPRDPSPDPQARSRHVQKLACSRFSILLLPTEAVQIPPRRHRRLGANLTFKSNAAPAGPSQPGKSAGVGFRPRISHRTGREKRVIASSTTARAPTLRAEPVVSWQSAGSAQRDIPGCARLLTWRVSPRATARPTKRGVRGAFEKSIAKTYEAKPSIGRLNPISAFTQPIPCATGPHRRPFLAF